jgi:hypothetical protein
VESVTHRTPPLAALGKASEYADMALRHVASDPGINLAVQRMPAETEEGYPLYTGKANREVFLIALLYDRIVNGVEYSGINYRGIQASGVFFVRAHGPEPSPCGAVQIICKAPSARAAVEAALLSCHGRGARQVPVPARIRERDEHCVQQGI